jgi:tetratricopeptide (TPR) repeat protein
MDKRVVGPEHQGVAIDLFNLASVARAQNRLADAELRLRDAVAMLRKLGYEDGFLAQALGFLGEVLRDEGKLDEAYQKVSEGLALRRKVLGNDSGEVAYSLVIVAGILDRQGKMADVEPLARECLAIFEAKTPDHWRVFEARSLLGASLMGQKKYADAEPLLLSGYEGLKQREDKLPTAIRPRLQPAIRRLVRLYEETGRADRAAEWKQRLAEFEQAEVQPKTFPNRE